MKKDYSGRQGWHSISKPSDGLNVIAYKSWYPTYNLNPYIIIVVIRVHKPVTIFRWVARELKLRFEHLSYCVKA